MLKAGVSLSVHLRFAPEVPESHTHQAKRKSSCQSRNQYVYSMVQKLGDIQFFHSLWWGPKCAPMRKQRELKSHETPFRGWSFMQTLVLVAQPLHRVTNQL